MKLCKSILALTLAVTPAFAQSHGPDQRGRGAAAYSGPNIGYLATRTICQSNAAVSAPSDTNEDTLATCAIPGNLMGRNGCLLVWATFTFTSSTNAKTMRVRYGGTQFAGPADSTSGHTTFNMLQRICNLNATNNQMAFQNLGGVFGGQGATNTGTLDSTQPLNLTITGQKALNTEALTLQMYAVQIQQAPSDLP